MTGPLVVLGVLSAVGGWLNLPAILPMGPVQLLHHWLEPVVGEPTLHVTLGSEAHLSHATEYTLIGVAVAIALAGITIAFARLKPAALVSKSQAPESEGFERVLEHKYYVDEIYDATVVRPTVGISRNILWKGMDAGIIDGLVNLSAKISRDVLGWIGSRLQSGQVGTYAWVLFIGVLFVLGAVAFS
jgi:NADH-quinone oxidoreductase subunit L